MNKIENDFFTSCKYTELKLRAVKRGLDVILNSKQYKLRYLNHLSLMSGALENIFADIISIHKLKELEDVDKYYLLLKSNLESYFKFSQILVELIEEEDQELGEILKELFFLMKQEFYN